MPSWTRLQEDHSFTGFWTDGGGRGGKQRVLGIFVVIFVLIWDTIIRVVCLFV